MTAETVRRAEKVGAMDLAPVAPNERILAIDLLRGWAIFGVLWSNLNDWYGTRDPVTTADRALAWMQEYLVESRFYTLLVLLFGIGFGIQLLRSDGRGVDLAPTYYRRTAALLLIGMIHGCLIWSGDILTIYALVAFSLVMFRRVSSRHLVVAAAILWLIGPSIVVEIQRLTGLSIMTPPEDHSAVYENGSWMQIEHARVAQYLDWHGRWGPRISVQILATFLIGLWAVRSSYLFRVLEDPKVTRRLLLTALIVAGVGYASSEYAGLIWPPPKPPSTDSLAFADPYFQLTLLRQTIFRLFNWSVEGTALAYACVLILLWQRQLGASLLKPLTAIGRMALTTYLTQSVVCTLLFYGYGLGWYGSMGFTGMFVITLLLFGCQMVVSNMWLKRFRFGPAEWVWRKLTYGRMPAMRRSDVGRE
jgi:uncharacterized protein